MEVGEGGLAASIDLDLEPGAAFDVLVDELALALERSGLRLEPGAAGRVSEGSADVGRVVEWRPGDRIRLEWRPAGWAPDGLSEVELRFEKTGAGTRVTLEHRGWGRQVGDGRGELAGWFASEVAAPMLRAAAPVRFGDWVTDRRARRPSGEGARKEYRHPTYHLPNFHVLLERLALTADDHLLEVGCGGGALLEQALRTGCRAAGVDHSADMVRLACEVNAAAVAAGRLDVHEASASHLPFGRDTFTAAVMTGVFGFLDDPVGALGEIRRVLRPGGRLALLGSSPELRGTAAAPEPMASRLHFYDDADVERLAGEAGLADIRVERISLGPFAREAGVPEEHIPMFASGPGAQFLFAVKAGGGGYRP